MSLFLKCCPRPTAILADPVAFARPHAAVATRSRHACVMGCAARRASGLEDIRPVCEAKFRMAAHARCISASRRNVAGGANARLAPARAARVLLPLEVRESQGANSWCMMHSSKCGAWPYCGGGRGCGETRSAWKLKMLPSPLVKPEHCHCLSSISNHEHYKSLRLRFTDMVEL